MSGLLIVLLFSNGCTYKFEKGEYPFIQNYKYTEFLYSEAEKKANAQYEKDFTAYKKALKGFNRIHNNKLCFKKDFERYKSATIVDKVTKELGAHIYNILAENEYDYTIFNISRTKRSQASDIFYKYYEQVSDDEQTVVAANIIDEKATITKIMKHDIYCYNKLK